MTDLTKPDAELARLARVVDRTRVECFEEPFGEERDRLWRLHQRAIENYNAALQRTNQTAVRAQA